MQVEGYMRYANDQWALAKRNGLTGAIGQEVCYNSKCVNVTESSILAACQFGCGRNGALDQFVKNGYKCDGPYGSGRDGSQVCVGKYLVAGANYDVSAVTNNNDADPSKRSAEQNSDSQRAPYSDAETADRLGNFRKCWTCEVIARTSDLVTSVVQASVPKLTTPALPLMVIIFGVVALFQVGKLVFWPQGGKWSQIWWMTVRFAIVYALLSSANFATDYALGWGYIPAMRAGAELGSTAAQAADLSLSGATPGGVIRQTQSNGWNDANGNCEYRQPELSNSLTSGASQSLANLACMVHNASYGIIVAGTEMVLQKRPAESASEWGSAAVITAICFFMFVSTFLALGNFAMSIVEAIIRIGIVLTFSPVLLFMWIFKNFNATKDIATNGLRMLVYGFFLLVISGALASISAFVMKSALLMGMGNNGAAGSATVTIQQVASWIDSNIANLNMTTGNGIVTVLKFALFTICGGLMSAHLIRAGSQIAQSLAGTQFNEFTSGVMSGVMGGAMSVIAGPLTGAGMLGTYFGGKALGAGAGALSGAAIAGGGAVKGAAGRILGVIRGAGRI
ncbi:hypothetical protein [Microvirga tunisiensis]|nr:hypothetical protein [Microvirga tunisiensis]MPR05669.1 hypothetical protein [Microvirga tunisiensis]